MEISSIGVTGDMVSYLKYCLVGMDFVLTTKAETLELLKSYSQRVIELVRSGDDVVVLPRCSNCGEVMRVYCYECKCGIIKEG